MYEHRRQKLLSPREFARRVLRHGGFACIVIGIALLIGVVGYRWLGRMSWVDSLLNASMILGGMGPVDRLTTTAAKVFASFYALFSGLVLIAAAGILLAPFLHRLVHRFHLESDNDKK